MSVIILLCILFALLLAFIAYAPSKLKQIALSGTWMVMVICAVTSVIRAMFR